MTNRIWNYQPHLSYKQVIISVLLTFWSQVRTKTNLSMSSRYFRRWHKMTAQDFLYEFLEHRRAPLLCFSHYLMLYNQVPFWREIADSNEKVKGQMNNISCHWFLLISRLIIINLEIMEHWRKYVWSKLLLQRGCFCLVIEPI